jgi:N-acetylglutamate synthase
MLNRDVEELTLNAWPPLQQLLYDGWVLSFSDGYTRRANSIHPLYPSSLPLANKIGVCEAIYAARGQETVFKLTSLGAQDAALDAALERRGYTKAATTSVQLANLSQLDSTLDASVMLALTLEDAWLNAFNRLSLTPERFHPTMERMLNNIAPPHAFASIAVDGHTIAQGLAVAERGCVGLFDIIVDAQFRNQGLGRRVITRLLQWSRGHSATQAYLAVTCDNTPALNLYAKLGFQQAYRYSYRCKLQT